MMYVLFCYILYMCLVEHMQNFFTEHRSVIRSNGVFPCFLNSITLHNYQQNSIIPNASMVGFISSSLQQVSVYLPEAASGAGEVL